MLFQLLLLAGGVQTIAPAGISSAAAFGSHLFVGTIAPSGIPSAGAMGSHGLRTATLAPSGISTVEALPVHAVSLAPATLSPAGISSGESLPTTHAVKSLVYLLPGGIPTSAAPGSHVLTSGVVVLPASGISSGFLAGSHTVAPGVVTIAPGGIASAGAYGSHKVTQNKVLFPAAITSAQAMGRRQFTRVVFGGTGTITLYPATIISEQTIDGVPVLHMGISVSGIPSAGAFGAPSLLQRIAPAGIASAESVSYLIVVQLAGSTILVANPGIASGFLSGSHTVTRAFSQSGLPGGVPSTCNPFAPAGCEQACV